MTSKRIFILVNHLRETQERLKTWLLAAEALRHGHEVYACGASDLELSSHEGLVLNAQALRPPEDYTPSILSDPQTQRYTLEPSDIVLVRTNPGRDAKHATLHHAILHMLIHAKRLGCLVLNDPETLLAFSTKTYLLNLPAELCPHSLISNDIARILDFAKALKAPFILKPLSGSRGQGVFMFENTSDSNIRSILETLSADGPLLVQEFVPEARDAEYRVFFLNGEPFARKGRMLAVRRNAAQGDFRNNVHAGAIDTADELPQQAYAAVHALGTFLKRQHLFWAGVDMAGTKVLEVNVFSPGGWDRIEQSQGEFTRAIVNAIEAF